MKQPMWNSDAVKAYETGQGVELVNEPYPHYIPNTKGEEHMNRTVCPNGMVDTCCENYDNCTLSYYDKDAEIKRLNEKIEFLARTNMLYSDWEHRETQVTSELIRKGIEEHKINIELRAEIERLKQRTWVGLTEDCVGWFGYDTGLSLWFETNKGDDGAIPLYKDQQQRTWVGLTDEEIETIYAECNVWDKFEYERMLEAKLKEKNNAT